VASCDLWVFPDGVEALVADHSPVVVGSCEAEFVATPDGDAAGFEGGRENGVCQRVDVLRARGRPDYDMEGVDAVL